MEKLKAQMGGVPSQLQTQFQSTLPVNKRRTAEAIVAGEEGARLHALDLRALRNRPGEVVVGERQRAQVAAGLAEGGRNVAAEEVGGQVEGLQGQVAGLRGDCAGECVRGEVQEHQLREVDDVRGDVAHEAVRCQLHGGELRPDVAVFQLMVFHGDHEALLERSQGAVRCSVRVCVVGVEPAHLGEVPGDSPGEVVVRKVEHLQRRKLPEPRRDRALEVVMREQEHSQGRERGDIVGRRKLSGELVTSGVYHDEVAVCDERSEDVSSKGVVAD